MRKNELPISSLEIDYYVNEVFDEFIINKLLEEPNLSPGLHSLILGEDKFNLFVLLLFLELIEKGASQENINFNHNLGEIFAELHQFKKSNNHLFEEKTPVIRTFIDRLESDIYDDPLGTHLQDQLKKGVRKNRAVNFTNLWVSRNILSFIDKGDNFQDIIDPFAGDGRLLSQIVGEKGQKKRKVFLFEIDLTSIVIAIINLILYNQLQENINFKWGDTFRIINNEALADLIITNPPFTRNENLSKDETRWLRGRFKEYNNYFGPHMGLHIFSMFLIHELLKEGGICLAILPASTLYSDYGRGLRKFFIDNFTDMKFFQSSENISFSDGSDLKEIIFVGKKGNSNLGNTYFNTINWNPTLKRIQEESSSLVSINELKTSWNWMKFFEIEIVELVNNLTSNLKLETMDGIKFTIKRGIEMYGPEFFFIPNRNWSILTSENKDSTNNLTIEHDGVTVEIELKHAKLCLRKTQYYKKKISAKVEHFVLSFPSSYKVPRSYLTSQRKYATSAQKKFGSDWFSHIQSQIRRKEPFSHIFVSDKSPLSTAGTFIHYFENKLTASKNFYLIEGSQRVSKLLAAWMSTSFFFLIYLNFRREIGGTYGRLQISDYKREKLFLSEKILLNYELEICKIFDHYRKLDLPPYKEQFGWDERRKLDEVFLRIIRTEFNYQIDLESLYSLINKRLNELLISDNSRK